MELIWNIIINLYTLQYFAKYLTWQHVQSKIDLIYRKANNSTLQARRYGKMGRRPFNSLDGIIGIQVLKKKVLLAILGMANGSAINMLRGVSDGWNKPGAPKDPMMITYSK